MAWFLEYSVSGGEKRQVRIEEGTLKIGRGSNSDTRIEDKAMSRLHCVLTLTNDAATLKDLGSTAGTYVHRQRISDTITLKAGENFHAGNTKFTLISDSPLDAPTQVASKKTFESERNKLAAKLAAAGKLDRFELRSTLDSGGRSFIFKAVDTEDGENVAVKVIPTDEGTEEDEARFKRAMKILQAVRDPFLVRLLRAGRKRNYCWVAMEWMPNGSLEDRVRKSGIQGVLDWKELWRVANSISQSLHILEKNGIVHRNIKPTNILVREIGKSYVLSDLVVAKVPLSTAEPLVTRQVYLPTDLAYTAPERLRGADDSEFTIQADIYSLGAVLMKLLTGKPPYGHGQLKDLLPRLRESRHTASVQSQIGINDRFVDLINAMTEPDLGKRFPSALHLWREVERVGKLSGLSGV